VLAQRLAAQGLAGRAAGPVEATRRLLAVQAQDPRGMRLAMRALGARRGALEAALDERALLVTWVNRGTLHLIAAEDEPLLHLLTTPQLRTANERRLRQEGVSDAAASRGVRALAKALSDGPLPRAQARAVLERAGVPVAGQAFTHVLFRATLDGLILRGGGELSFVLASDWLGERPRLDRDAGRRPTATWPAGRRSSCATPAVACGPSRPWSAPTDCWSCPAGAARRRSRLRACWARSTRCCSAGARASSSAPARS
jgi:hypothetical protein